MSMVAFGERLRIVTVTAIVTAVATSAAWLAWGGGGLDSVGNLAVLRKVETVPAGSAAPASAKDAPLRNPRARVPGSARAGEYLVPVAGVRGDQLSDTFTQARDSGARVHDAIDIMAPRGTPVIAAVAGTVEKLFNSRAGGLTVYVRSPDRRTITYYAHLDAYAPGLAEGQQLRQGQAIGTVGSTGNADPAAPHLHFAIMQTTPEAGWWEPANAVNPYPALTGR